MIPLIYTEKSTIDFDLNKVVIATGQYIWRLRLANIKDCMGVLNYLSKNGIPFRCIEGAMDEILIDPGDKGLDEESFKKDLIAYGNADEIDFEVYDARKIFQGEKNPIRSEKLRKIIEDKIEDLDFEIEAKKMSKDELEESSKIANALKDHPSITNPYALSRWIVQQKDGKWKKWIKTFEEHH